MGIMGWDYSITMSRLILLLTYGYKVCISDTYRSEWPHLETLTHLLRCDVCQRLKLVWHLETLQQHYDLRITSSSVLPNLPNEQHSGIGARNRYQRIRDLEYILQEARDS